MSRTAPSPATAQLLREQQDVCSAIPAVCGAGKKRGGFFIPLFTSGADDANHPPHKEGGLQPHMVLGIPEPEAAGAVQIPKWRRLSGRTSPTHTPMKCETLQLSAGLRRTGH